MGRHVDAAEKSAGMLLGRTAHNTIEHKHWVNLRRAMEGEKGILGLVDKGTEHSMKFAREAMDAPISVARKSEESAIAAVEGLFGVIMEYKFYRHMVVELAIKTGQLPGHEEEDFRAANVLKDVRVQEHFYRILNEVINLIHMTPREVYTRYQNEALTRVTKDELLPGIDELLDQLFGKQTLTEPQDDCDCGVCEARRGFASGKLTTRAAVRTAFTYAINNGDPAETEAMARDFIKIGAEGIPQDSGKTMELTEILDGFGDVGISAYEVNKGVWMLRIPEPVGKNPASEEANEAARASGQQVPRGEAGDPDNHDQN